MSDIKRPTPDPFPDTLLEEQTIVPTRGSAVSGARAILYFSRQTRMSLMAYERLLVGVEKILLHRRHVYVPTFRIAGLVTGIAGDRSKSVPDVLIDQ